jgi:hypothetical protein
VNVGVAVAVVDGSRVEVLWARRKRVLRVIDVVRRGIPRNGGVDAERDVGAGLSPRRTWDEDDKRREAHADPESPSSKHRDHQ